MTESAPSSMLEEKLKEDDDNSKENMGQVKSKFQKMTKLSKRKVDDFSHIKTDGMEHMYMCGVVEGFYGRPWTSEQRKELFGRMEDMGLNTYLYAPKDDYKHRLFWREKYSPDEAQLLKALIDSAEEHSVTFVYAISPGLDMVFGAKKEVTCLQEKLLQVKSLGCKAFALLFDDIDPVLCATDMDEFESSAHAQASITNLMFEALDHPRFLFCPTEYCTNMAIPDVKNSNYLSTLGNALHPHVSIMWTGPKVVSNVISVESIQILTSVLKRKIVIWDNIHANDYDPKRVFLGPYKGRSSTLVPELAGVLTNPNCEFEANFIAMHTLATWWKSCKGGTADSPVHKTVEPLPLPQPPTSPVKENISEQSSISSDRASDIDSETDSDYSSHDGSIYPLSFNFDHADYNPEEALRLAIQDWLPIFSCVRYPVRKRIPRSGTAPALPMLPNHPIISKPPSSSATSLTSTVVEPMISARLSVGSRPQSPFVLDGNSKPGCEEAKPLRLLEHKLNVESDVDMPSSKESDFCDKDKELDKLKDDSIERGQISVEDMTCPTVALPGGDVEMKEASGEKANEVMQTETSSSLKAVSSIQMETEEGPASTPLQMQTDDIDSDVSMATAQSGSMVPIDIDDMGSPYVAPIEEDVKQDNAITDSIEVEAKSSQDDIMATPSISADKAEENIKVEAFDPLSVEDLHLLVQCFFLPYEHGLVGKEMVSKFRWLKENAFKLSKSDDKKSEKYLDKALHWSERALAFEEQCRDILKVFNQICACPNRALLFDLFPYLWDLKGVVSMLRSYIKWLATTEVRSSDGDEKSISPPSSPSPLRSYRNWLGADPEPWVFRGGLSGEFQRLLPVASSFDLFCQTLPHTPQVCTFIVRPFTPSDEASVFNICYATHNDGMECSDSFSDHKDLPADKLVGALLTLSPDYCFVVEDETGLCGYLAACLSAKTFWKKYELAYLPEMREKYDKPEKDADMSEAEMMIVDLHSEGDRFSYADEEMSSSYPSMMCIALKQATNISIAKSMTVCLLSALKSHKSCGVHALISNDSVQLLDLYTKLGFTSILGSDLLDQNKHKLMGRTF